jgi:hypothetical protein
LLLVIVTRFSKNVKNFRTQVQKSANKVELRKKLILVFVRNDLAGLSFRRSEAERVQRECTGTELLARSVIKSIDFSHHAHNITAQLKHIMAVQHVSRRMDVSFVRNTRGQVVPHVLLHLQLVPILLHTVTLIFIESPVTHIRHIGAKRRKNHTLVPLRKRASNRTAAQIGVDEKHSHVLLHVEASSVDAFRVWKNEVGLHLLV